MTPRNPADRPVTEPRTLTDMKPEDKWSDKFYAALGELWQAVRGTEIPAMGEPPHLVMARLIEDVRWAEAAQGAAPRAEGLDFDSLDLAIRNAYDEYGTAGVIREYARLSRPSDERVPESEAE